MPIFAHIQFGLSLGYLTRYNDFDLALWPTLVYMT